eukprot:GILJ01023040.1.p1 GENE.GILJ01023040.1~~GILJ01023040.1.p1  ORF type:complete len:207 (-),score=44.37 GILJ01023040.1:95-670(-)
MKVRSTTGYLSLLKIVKNPITDHIPANARLIRVEKDGELVDMFEHCKTLGNFTSPTNEAGAAAAVGSKRPREEEKQPSRKAEEVASSDDEGELIDSDEEDAGPGYRTAQSDANELFDGVRTKALASTTFAPFAFVIGGMSKGDVNAEYAPQGQVDSIRLGNRGMSAASVCSVILHAFEEAWLEKPDAAQQL